jgi:N utilization substance protein B
MGPKKDRVVSRASFRISAARLAAIQALYELSLSNRNPKEVLETFAAKRWRSITLRDPDSKPGSGGKARLPNPDLDYLSTIVMEVSDNSSRYEGLIKSILGQKWTINRLDFLMLALLKSAAFEISEKKETSIGIIVGEYSDLAHTFFDDKDAKFATGIINQMAEDIRILETS